MPKCDLDGIYWAAGFLEGDGCFSLQYNTSRNCAVPRISAPQVYEEPLLKLQRQFGGIIRRERGKYFRWTLVGSRAAAAMMSIYTLMFSKRRKQIYEGLRYWRSRKAAAKYRMTCPRDHKLEPYSGKGSVRVCKICKREECQRRRWRDIEKTRAKANEYARDWRRRKKMQLELLGGNV